METNNFDRHPTDTTGSAPDSRSPRDLLHNDSVGLPALPEGAHESMILCSNRRQGPQNSPTFALETLKRCLAMFLYLVATAFVLAKVAPPGPPAVWSYGIVTIYVAAMLWANRYQFGPTAIQVGQNGIRLHWIPFIRNYTSPWIAWDLIESVNKRKRKQFSLYKFTDVELISFRIQMSAAPPAVRQFLERSRLCGLVADSRGNHSISMQINPVIITHETDVKRLLDALKFFLPSDALDPGLSEFVEASEGTSFTSLWLEEIEHSSADQVVEIGSTVGSGRYSIQQVLATGGHAVTYVALDLSPASSLDLSPASSPDLSPASSPEPASASPTVVLKEIVLPVAGGREIFDRALKNVMREAELLKKLDNPQIVKCHDFFVQGGRAYLVLDFIEGQSLRRLVNERGALEETRVRDLTRQMCDLLRYLHSLKPPIIHRDFTPDNLILKPDNTLVLVDFNVAEQREAFETATVVGKHAYIPPEQFRGQATTGSDIYALGCCAHFLLTGEDPEPLSISNPAKIKPHVSAELDRLVAKATQPHARDRYQTVDEISAETIIAEATTPINSF